MAQVWAAHGLRVALPAQDSYKPVVTRFRPCIDLHQGQVKQIVGKTLEDPDGPHTNFVASEPAEYFASLYREDELSGGHVICLGPGNATAAARVLKAWPAGLQLGGGVDDQNARDWLERGAAKVIVTSFLFPGAELDQTRLDRLARAVTAEELVIDLSCRRVGEAWFVATERWKTLTATRVDRQLFERMRPFCSEFLIHAVDVEGRGSGIDEDLVAKLGDECPLPCTYAGGARALDDLERVERLSRGRVDLTFGSALDIFGGTGVRYRDCVEYNRELDASSRA